MKFIGVFGLDLSSKIRSLFYKIYKFVRIIFLFWRWVERKIECQNFM